MAITDDKKFEYKEYVESDAVRQAKAALDAQLAQKPGAYQSPWQTQLNDTLTQIQNRPQFQFDMNGSVLWNQYKDRYVQQGRQAMMDTMGQAAAMTGGYGNSYAQSVGQQTYQGYLQGLNDKLGEVYGMELDRYNQEGQDLYNRYGLLADQEDRAYGLYRDAVSDYNAALDRAQGVYDSERNWDYTQYADGRDFAYQQNRDAIADAQWQAEYDEAIRQWNLLHNGSSSGSGGSRSGSGGSGGTVSSSTESAAELEARRRREEAALASYAKKFYGKSYDYIRSQLIPYAAQKGYTAASISSVAQAAYLAGKKPAKSTPGGGH